MRTSRVSPQKGGNRGERDAIPVRAVMSRKTEVNFRDSIGERPEGNF